MNIEKITRNGQNIAVISSAELLITDVQSAVDLLMDAQFFRFLRQNAAVAVGHNANFH